MNLVELFFADVTEDCARTGSSRERECTHRRDYGAPKRA